MPSLVPLYLRDLRGSRMSGKSTSLSTMLHTTNLRLLVSKPTKNPHCNSYSANVENGTKMHREQVRFYTETTWSF